MGNAWECSIRQELAGNSPALYSARAWQSYLSVVEDGDHPWQFIGILHDIQGINITAPAANQIVLIDDFKSMLGFVSPSAPPLQLLDFSPQ